MDNHGQSYASTTSWMVKNNDIAINLNLTKAQAFDNRNKAIEIEVIRI